MTLRQALDGEVQRVHQLVDELLDREDALIVLIDGQRTVSYAAGFALSPCHLELVTAEIERIVRTPRQTGTEDRRRENSASSSRAGHRTGDRGLAAGAVLRLARKTPP